MHIDLVSSVFTCRLGVLQVGGVVMTDIEWPEGATHRIDERFKKWVEGIEYTYSDGEWVLTLPQRSLERYIESEYKHKIIERPKEPETYKPEVGEWCEYNKNGRVGREVWEKCMFLAEIDGEAFVLREVGGLSMDRMKAYKGRFRPIKSERDQFIEKSVSLTEMDGNISIEGFGIQYDNGARFEK